jgi:hypothetical protein
MRPAVLVSLLNEICLKQRRQVVELGSGTSTLFLARALRDSGGRLLSVEHDSEWAGYVDRRIREERLDDVATVAQVPLASYAAPPGSQEDPRWPPPPTWYETEALLSACPADIDLLVVDGPPAGKQEGVLAREPAVPVLRRRLARGFTLVLDDADRAAERETVLRWEQQLGLQMSLVERIALAIGRSDGGFFPYL